MNNVLSSTGRATEQLFRIARRRRFNDRGNEEETSCDSVEQYVINR